MTIGPSSQALDHPHVFIDTKVTAVLDAAGQLDSIRLRWDYDAMLSMVVVEDKGADADQNGLISPTEEQALDGFDMTWVEGFDGDTSIFQSNAVVGLELGPKDWATGWTADDSGGHLWSEHTRKLPTPIDPRNGPISIVIYDLTDYTSYSLTDAVLQASAVQGGSAAIACQFGPPDPDAASHDTGLFSTLGLFLFGDDLGPMTQRSSPIPRQDALSLSFSATDRLRMTAAGQENDELWSSGPVTHRRETATVCRARASQLPQVVQVSSFRP